MVKVAIGDAETMNLGDAHSLIVSANAVQWFDNHTGIVERRMDACNLGDSYYSIPLRQIILCKLRR
jgi:trans-aconitate methyltransferase